MRALARRLGRLEDQIVTADKPRSRLRLMVMMAGSRPSLEDASCTRSLCKDGSLLELVRFERHNDRPDDLTDEELDDWVEMFPVLDLRQPSAASTGSR